MNAPAARPRDELVTLNQQLTTRADQFRMVLPNHISVEKFQRTILTAVQNDPELLNADRQSFLLACMKCAQDGLLPDKREAALVIFKENKQVGGQWETRLLVQYMPMVYGLRKKILQSGEVSDIQTSVVYRQDVENGAFYYEEGTNRTLRHKPDMLAGPYSDDDVVGAFSMAWMKDGTVSFEVMRRWEIDKVREKSQTGATKTKRGEPRKPSGPWVEWFSEQCRKTVLRRHSKSLPMSGDIIDVEASDDIAAASATALLANQPAAPAIAPPPTRQAIAQQPVDNVIDMTMAQQQPADPVPAGGDPRPGPDLEAARQAMAADDSLSHLRDPGDPGPGHDDDGVVQGNSAPPPADDQPDPEAFEFLQKRINTASSVASLGRIVGDIKAHLALTDQWRATLLTNADLKKAELTGGAK